MRNSRQMILSVGGVLGAVALAMVFLVLPNYREARAVRAQAEDLRARSATLNVRQQAVERLAEEVRLAKEHAASDLKIIPESADIAGLIRKLSDSIDGVNVVDQTFTAGTPGEAIIGGNSTAMSLPVSADMRATFESVMALIRKAESMERLVRVSSVQLACKREEPKAGVGAPNSRSSEYGSPVPLLTASVGLEVIYDTLEKPAGK